MNSLQKALVANGLADEKDYKDASETPLELRGVSAEIEELGKELSGTVPDTNDQCGITLIRMRLSLAFTISDKLAVLGDLRDMMKRAVEKLPKD